MSVTEAEFLKTNESFRFDIPNVTIDGDLAISGAQFDTFEFSIKDSFGVSVLGPLALAHLSASPGTWRGTGFAPAIPGRYTWQAILTKAGSLDEVWEVEKWVHARV